jgi:hypothetical protein
MVEVAHDEACLTYRRRGEEARRAYAENWPSYCRTCQGWGYGCYTYDPSPSGVALGSGSVSDCDPCPACTDEGVCPRCGQRVWDPDTEQDWVCPNCGYDASDPDGMPTEPECCCDDEHRLYRSWPPDPFEIG